jgi:hypothetical protein
LINPQLHVQPVALDAQQHRQLRVSLPVTDWSVAKRLNAVFVAATEFSDVCKEYPIVFVRAGKEADGREQIAPVAVLGVLAEQNLYLDGPELTQWRAAYRPAVLQAYPFCIGRVDEQTFAICIDMAWSGLGAEGGQALFDSAGQASEVLKAVRQHLELLEREIRNTRAFGSKLLELDLLRDMRFDATLPDGRKHTVDGFLTVDVDKAGKLPDPVVGELHRNGMLGLIQLHWTSLALMRRLVDWHVQRHPAAAAPGGAAGTPPGSAAAA